MRKKASFANRTCASCGELFQPSGANQRYCKKCANARAQLRKNQWYKAHHPDSKPKQKCTEPCCVCGGPFAGMLDGKPYCNKHWQRMYRNNSIEPKIRERTCEYRIDGDVLCITTARGEKIVADAADYGMLKKYSWCISSGYPVANIEGHVTTMHRYLLGLRYGDSVIVDHANRNRCDNRRANLRIATPADNVRNRGKPKSSSQNYLGVRLVKSGKYQARIMANRKEINLGRYMTEEEAYEARKQGEDLYHGEFASHKATEEGSKNK